MSLILPAVLGGRYELLEEIGTGAYASVYRAHDHVLNRAVAVKVLRDEITSEETFARFAREVHVTATLEHAHILHVHDSGKHEGRPYIVTEFATGGTLSEKMSRDGQLQIADALQITCEVGIALAHAHASGVVHRDVKPDNILLGRGGVLLADFGIAISDTDEFRTRLTGSGMAVGTVQYMSPEQLCAERDIDGCSDQYALACVLYEMLAGVCPHVSATMEGLRLQRLAGQHLSVRVHRPSVPEQVDAAIMRALCSMAADRHRDIPAFLAALGMAGSGEFAALATSAMVLSARGSHSVKPDNAPAVMPGREKVRENFRQSPRPLRSIAALGLAGALALVVVAYTKRDDVQAFPAPSDQIRVLLSSPVSEDSLSVQARVYDALRAELAAWPSVEMVDRLSSSDSNALRIVPMVALIGDSVRVSLSVRRGIDADQPQSIGAAMVQNDVSLRALAADLAREALAGMSSAEIPGLHDLPVRSLQSLRSYVAGHVFLRRGALDSAALAFRDAARVTSSEPRFAHAYFWAAQADGWRAPRNPESWRSDIELAVNSRRLHGLDSVLASGLQLMARANYPAACVQYRVASLLDPTSFVAWFGLGECARVDPMVEVQSGQARFRSSIWSALSAYRSAVETAPTPALLAALFPQILQATFAESGRVRAGAASEPSSERFRALPSLVNDTLAFFPIGQSEIEQMQARTVPATFAAAVRRGRSVALDLTDRWIKRTPNAAEPWLFRAYALELAGRLEGTSESTSALLALDRAAVDAPNSELRARIAVARTRILLRQGNMDSAARTANAALDDTVARSVASSLLLAPLAALLGDVTRLEALSLPTSAENLPNSMVAPLDAFTVRAWLGACDELNESRRILEERAKSSFSPDERDSARALWLAPAYRAAVPCLGPSAMDEFEPRIPLDRAYHALSAHDRDEARRVLEEARSQRSGASSSAVSWDYLFAESWALAQAGDSAAARAQLLSALEDIANMSGLTMDYVPLAAGLRRGLSLLRDLSEGVTDDPILKRWSDRADVLLNHQSRGSTP